MCPVSVSLSCPVARSQILMVRSAEPVTNHSLPASTARQRTGLHAGAHVLPWLRVHRMEKALHAWNTSQCQRQSRRTPKPGGPLPSCWTGAAPAAARPQFPIKPFCRCCKLSRGAHPRRPATRWHICRWTGRRRASCCWTSTPCKSLFLWVRAPQVPRDPAVHLPRRVSGGPRPLARQPPRQLLDLNPL